MFVHLCKEHLKRSTAFERKIVSSVTARFRSQSITTPRRLNGVDALRDRIEEARRRVAESERIVDGWCDLIGRKQAEGGDVTEARSLLAILQSRLDVAISDQNEAEKALTQRLRDIFDGVHGRGPKTDHELGEWLASSEGKAATMFEPAPLPSWMELGRRS